MKKRRFMVTLAVLTILAVSILSVSCQEPASVAEPEVEIEDDTSPVEAYISIIEDKGVTVEVPDEVATYQYRAIPLFDVEATEGDGTIFGEQLTWRAFKTEDEGRLATMGYYRQGYWRFEVRTLNKNKQVLMTGSTKETGDVYLQKGKDNIINLTLHTDDGEGRSGQSESTGRIVFGFETNWLSDSQDVQYVRIEVDKLTTQGVISTENGKHDFMFPLQGGTAAAVPVTYGWEKNYSTAKGTVTGYQDGWTTVLPGGTDTGVLATNEDLGFATVVPEGRIRFYASTPELKKVETDGVDADGNKGTLVTYTGGISAGNYIVRVKVCTIDTTIKDDKGKYKEIVIGGQSMAVKVVGGETTVVTGSLLLEKYQKSSLSITLPDNVKGSLSSSGTNESFVIQADNLTNQKIKLTFTADEDKGTDADFYKNMTFEWRVNGELVQSQTSRTYEFAPSTWGDYKITCIATGKTGTSNQLGEITSSTMVVRVIEEKGPNV